MIKKIIALAFVLLLLLLVWHFAGLKSAGRTISETRKEILDRTENSLSKDELYRFKDENISDYDDLQKTEESLGRLGRIENRLDRIRGIRQQPEPATSSASAEYAGNLEDFRQTSLNPEHGEYAFQIDARGLWQDTIETDGDTDAKLVLTGSGSACPGRPDPCAGPNGILGLAKYDKIRSGQFPVGNAMYYALVARFVDRPGYQEEDVPGFQVGAYKEVEVPSGHKVLQVRDNIGKDFRHVASRGHQIKIQFIYK